MSDEKFLRNVREARECGYDLCCSECGVGIQDDSDSHDMFCSLNPECERNYAMAERWTAKQAKA